MCSLDLAVWAACLGPWLYKHLGVPRTVSGGGMGGDCELDPRVLVMPYFLVISFCLAGGGFKDKELTS